MGTGGGVNHILSPFPPVSELGSGACKGFGGGAVNEPHPGILPPTAAFGLAADAPVDSSSERGAKSEHTGTGFARNNTDPSNQHLHARNNTDPSNQRQPNDFEPIERLRFFSERFPAGQEGQFGLCVCMCVGIGVHLRQLGEKLMRSVGGVVRSSS